MIRLATVDDFPQTADNEVLVRILALRKAYGPEVSFIRYYTDGEGALLSIMDGVALFHTESVNEEWSAFLCMNPDISHIHCSAGVGHSLMQTDIWQGRVGDVLRYTGAPVHSVDGICAEPYLPAVYDLLKCHFEGIASLDSWYPDVSHRVRHGCCHIASVLQGDAVVSTAMTVAETDDAVILGQIATHPDFRRRGLAGKCIKSLISRCKVETLYILPLNEAAHKLYVNLGFSPCGTWAELERKYNL